MFEVPKRLNLAEKEEPTDPYEVVDYFEQHKFSKDLDNTFTQLTGSDPRNFFSEEILNELRKKSAGERSVLLARACMHVTTRPSDIDKYLAYFPEDTEALEAMVTDFSEHCSDGITFVFTSLLVNRFPERNRNGQMSEIYERRELAPDYLLNGYEHDMGSARIEREFGEAGRGYVEASKEASELEFAGDRPFERLTPFDTPEFEALEEAEKSRMLRTCLGAQQLGMVFEEALNSAFTKDSVQRRNERIRQSKADRGGYGINYDPGHSMIYGTVQGNSAYELPASFFERQMNSTADTGGYVEEYAEHKLTLATVEAFIRRAPDPENVSLLVDFWNKNRNPIFGNAVAEALTKQGPEQAAHEILELIKSDVHNKNALASILYRLELGKIGMSPEGVRYMGRLYNLGELNNPDFFVNRLTANGQVGVFDDAQKMVGYFELGDLSDEQDQINTEVMAVTYETLFKDRGDVSDEERLRREGFIKEFTEKYFELYNNKFYEKTGARFNNLSFEEQGWFLAFVNEGGPNIQESVYDFVSKFGEDGIRAFLSMEFDRKMGHHVMDNIAQSEKGSEILGLYNHLLIATRNTIEELGDKVPDATKNSLEASLMKKAKDILASDSFDEETLKQLEQVRVNNVVFTSAFRTLRTEGAIAEGGDVELLSSASFESIPSSKLSPVDKLHMLEIFDTNWAQEPTEFSSKVRSGLEASFNNPKTSFYTLRHNDEVIGYARVDDQSDAPVPHMYFGSFNVDESYGGSKIGEFIYKELIKQSVKKYDRVEADCDPTSDISKFYLRDFVATEYYLAGGIKPSFHIVYDKEQYENTAYSSLSEQKIIEHAESASYKSGDVIVRTIEPNDQFSELGVGRILTRYFNSKQTGKTYGVFELHRMPLKKAA